MGFLQDILKNIFAGIFSSAVDSLPKGREFGEAREYTCSKCGSTALGKAYNDYQSFNNYKDYNNGLPNGWKEKSGFPTKYYCQKCADFV